MPTPADDRLAARLREAHAALDERPSARARAAVLTAAAPNEAPMEPAAFPTIRTPARRPRPAAPRPWWAWRPPLAAGVAALAGVLALSIGLRVERERAQAAPDGAGTMEPAPTNGAPVPAAALNPAPAPAAPPRSERPTGSASGALAPHAITSARGAAIAPRASPEPVPKAFPLAVPAPAGDDARARDTSPSTTPALPAPSPAPSPAPPAAAGADARSASQRQSMQQSLERSFQVPKASAPATGSELATPPDGTDAGTWLQRIVALRAAGRDVEADAELDRFRAAYPGAVVPPRALRALLAPGPTPVPQ